MKEIVVLIVLMHYALISFSQVGNDEFISNPIIKNGDVYSVELPYEGSYIHWYTDTDGVYMETLNDNSARMHYLEYNVKDAKLYAELRYNGKQIGGSWIAIETEPLSIIGSDYIYCCEILQKPNYIIENAKYEWSFTDNIDYIIYPNGQAAFVSIDYGSIDEPISATLKVTTLNGRVHQVTKCFTENLITELNMYRLDDASNNNRKAFVVTFDDEFNINDKQPYKVGWNIFDFNGNEVDRSNFYVEVINGLAWTTVGEELLQTRMCPFIQVPVSKKTKNDGDITGGEDGDGSGFNPIYSQIAGEISRIYITFPPYFKGKVVCTVRTDCELLLKEEMPITGSMFNISPNPADNYINIKVNVDNYFENGINVSIYNDSSLIRSIRFDEKENVTVDTNDLDNGTYYVVIYSDNGNILHRQKVIIKR